MSEASSERPPSVTSGSSSRPTAAPRWVRFDESVSTETEISEPSFSDNNSVASGAISLDPSGLVPAPAPKVSLASSGRRSAVNAGNSIGSGNIVSPTAVKLAAQQQQPSSLINYAHNGDVASSRGDVESTGSSSVGSVTTASSKRDPNSLVLTNGKTLANIRPGNTSCPWLTPPTFDAYKIPASLTSNKLTLPVEEYVVVMERLIKDSRFRAYTVLYRRLIVSWLIVSLLILVGLLLGLRTVVTGFGLFGVALGWFFVLGIGILACMFLKGKIDRGKRDCVADVNHLLVRHNLLVGLDDHGQLSCHKITIAFIYFNIKDCLPTIIRHMAANDAKIGEAAVMKDSTDYDAGGGQRQLSTEERAERLVLKYSQAYVKESVRKTSRFPTRPLEGVSDYAPLHCSHSLCLCQYIQKNYFDKPPRSCFQYFC